MVALTVLNAARLRVLGPALTLLVEQGRLTGWVGLSLTDRASYDSLEPAFVDRHLAHLRFPEKTFRDRREALDYLADVEGRHAEFNLGLALAAEKRVPVHFPNGMTDVADLMRGVERVLEEDQVTAFLGDYPASTADLACYQLCKSRGMPAQVVSSSRLPERGLLAFRDMVTGRVPRVHEAHRRFRLEGIPPSLRERAREYVAAVSEKHLKPSYVAVRQDSGDTRTWQARLAARVARLSSLSQAAHRVGRMWNAAVLRKRWGEVFSDLDPGDRSVFFPVQFFPEASVSVRAPFFKHQYNVIENLCYALPAGYTLYAKEHPIHVRQDGVRHDRLADYLARLPNLRFLDPDTDSHEAVRHAECTVVLSSTAGWEAFLFGKPVIQLGVCEYSDFPGIHRVDSFAELAQRLPEVIASHEVDAEEVELAVASMMAGTLPGYIDDPRFSPEVLDDENIARVAAALVDGLPC